MRLTILSILTTCLFPCLVDSTYGQGGEQHNIYDPGQALWNRLADEFHGNDYNTTHVDEYGTISMTFMVEESHTGGAKPNGAVELHDRAADHNSTRSNRVASVGEGKKGLNAVNVKVVMTGPGGPLAQDVTILPEKFIQTASSGGGDDDDQLKQGNDKVVRKKPGQAGGDVTINIITRKIPTLVGVGQDDGQQKIGNDKIVRKKPGRTTYAHITLSPVTDGTDLASWEEGVEKGMVDLTNGSSVTLYDMDGEVAAATAIEYGLMAARMLLERTCPVCKGKKTVGGEHCRSCRGSGSIEGKWDGSQEHGAATDPDFEDPLTAINDRTAIEYALIAALLRSSGSQGDLHVWHDGNQTTMMNLETGSAVVVEQHVIRDPGG